MVSCKTRLPYDYLDTCKNWKFIVQRFILLFKAVLVHLGHVIFAVAIDLRSDPLVVCRWKKSLFLDVTQQTDLWQVKLL